MIPARQANSRSMMEKAGRTFPPEETEPAGHTLKERPAGVTIITLGTHEFIIRRPFSRGYLFVFFFLVDRLAFFLVALFLVAFFLEDRFGYLLACPFWVDFFFLGFFLVERRGFCLVAFFLVAFFLVDRLVFFLAAFFFVAFFFAIGFGSFPECAPINGPAIPLGAHCGE